MKRIREIHFSIIGQPISTKLVENTIATSRMINSYKNKYKKPIVFLFAGPSGHGKPELAKKMKKFITDEIKENNFINIDCTNHKTAIEMFGGGGACQGSEIGSKLNNFIVNNDSKPCIVLLDEFEKVNKDVWNGFLIPFDDKSQRIIVDKFVKKYLT